MATMVTGIFRDEPHVKRAVDELVENHHNPEDISVVVVTPEGREAVPVEHKGGMGRGAAVGATLGATLGGIGAGLASAGILAVPAVAILAAGPVLAVIQGVLAGGGVGTLAGLLAGMGMWREEVDLHAAELEKGKVLVGVHTATAAHMQRAKDAMARAEAERITVCDDSDEACEHA